MAFFVRFRSGVIITIRFLFLQIHDRQAELYLISFGFMTKPGHPSALPPVSSDHSTLLHSEPRQGTGCCTLATARNMFHHVHGPPGTIWSSNDNCMKVHLLDGCWCRVGSGTAIHDPTAVSTNLPIEFHHHTVNRRQRGL